MRIILTILFFSISFCYSQAQAKYVWGKNESGKQGWYTVTGLPMTNTVQTAIKHLSDSLKALYVKVIALEKRNKILTDSITQMSVADTVKFTGNAKVKQIRKHYSEVEIK